MEIHFILILLLSLSHSLDVKKADQCVCAKIAYLADCKAAAGCSWDTTQSTCSSSAVIPVDSSETYCSLITDSAQCAKTRACAYFDSLCKPFTGCSAYLGASNIDCQTIHQWCNSDGTYCVDPTTCSTYKTQTDCTEKSSSSGSGTCIWESTCRDQKCTEASTDLTTDLACSQFISTCVTTGHGCVTAPLPTCSTYSGDVTTCEGLKGSDGLCEGTETGTKCSAKDCKNAPGNTTTDVDCAAYQVGCITNGKGCLKTLTACASYTTQGSAEFCVGLIGSDGVCEFDTGTKCKLLSCESASESLNTDEDCNNYRVGCYTTGKGCITTRGNCSSYKGTTATCEGYIGSDGNCKGTNETTASACTPRLCQDANSTLNTDKDCNIFQKACKTTGKGCASTLGACSSYTGDSSSCDGYVGSDGKCKGGSTSGPCSPKVCSEAATTLTTNEECSAYQINCVAQQNGGCLQASSCPALFKQLSCGGLQTCQWNNLCVANTSCSSFTIQGICNENQTKDKISCFWDTGASPNCRVRQCTDAPNTIISDSDCNTFLKDCWTNGAGCFAQSTVCSAYKGTQSACETFTRKCTNLDTAIATTPCVEKNCTDNITATSDSDCTTFKQGCLTKGTGCIAQTQPCTAYSGTQDECNKFTGNYKRCWNTGSSGPCMDKLCSHAPSTVATDEECANFLSVCLFKGTGAGCIDSTSECTSYTGTSTTCATFTGNSKKCHKTDVCADRVCSDKSSAVDQADCANYKPSCRYLKGACVDSNTCGNYAGAQLSECQDVLDSSSLKCWWTTGSTCTDRTCALSPNKSNDNDCNNFKQGCVYAKNSSGTAVCIAKGNCNTYYGTPEECKGYKNGSDVLCWSTATGTSSVQCSDRACNIITNLTPETECTGHLPSCIMTRPTAGNSCVSITTTTCAQLQGTDEECKAMTGSNGRCWTGSQTGATKAACVLRDCSQLSTPASTDACIAHLDTCVRHQPTAGTFACIAKTSLCTAYKGSQLECQLLVGNSIKCWKSANSYGACEVRDCTTAPNNSNDADCMSHLDSCRYSCTAAGNSTKKCISLPTSCTSYFETPDNCKTMKAYTASADVLCWSIVSGSSVVACTNRACNHLANPTSDSDCKTHMASCRLSQPAGGNVCITQGLCSTYSGTPTQCKAFTGTDGNCWPADATQTAAASCIVRTCNMNTTAQTDAECDTFFTGCKTTGRGCIDPSTICSSLSGTTTSCNSLISSTANVYCKAGTGNSSNCQVRQCFDNGDATTDADCETFLKGCITKGKGCVPSTTPCSNLIGNQTSCGALVGNSIKCWSLNTSTIGACIDRLCEHNTTATSDASCDEFLKGCLTKGTGCVDPTKSCTSYAGVTATCEKYKGSSQTKTCTNDSTASSTTSCKEKDCTKNTTAASDAECNSYGIHCVYKGQTGGCQSKGLCSQMKGNIVTCAIFTATDGPCKGSVDVGKTDAACAPRVCSEAPNNLDTDEKCRIYHPTCFTNGYGCQVSVNCNDFQGAEACGLKTGCLWTGQCRDLETNCNTYSALGASICKNAVVSTGMKSCAWKNNTCIAMTCEDLPATISTEDECIAQSNTCTYKGEGCITKGVCSSYKTEVICISAKATDGTGTCAWDSTTGCRTKICQDSTSGDTNEKCEAFIPGCKTNGVGCVQNNFSCSQIQTKGLCISDGTGLPCLWVLGKCYQYFQCTDIAYTTHADCQKISPLCTTDDTKCIAFDKCASYKKQSSCVTGTDGNCGWTPAKKCQLFSACTDVTGTTNDVCSVYNSACITDGKACVEFAECSTYLTDVACNKGGKDGVCYWDKSGVTCRQRQCSDSTSNNKTHTGCYAYQASTSCTTTGTACIPLDTCSTYTTQAGCVLGTDGNCSWSATAKSCKLKDCTDIKKTKTADCIKEMNTCVSNGTNCVPQAACATYTSKTACNSGGLSNEICAFTPATSGSSTGKCQKMTSCADGSSDQASCAQFPASCKWTAATTTASSICAPHTCESLAKGTVCNPIPSFDGLTYSVCILQGGKCVLGDPSALTSDVCFRLSALTYSWDSKNNKCVSCGAVAMETTNTTTTNTTNTSNTQTTSGRGEIINLGSLFLILALLE